MIPKYIMHRELSTGKGFADVVFIPRNNVDSPAIVVELKHNKTSGAAIEQIKNKNYTEKSLNTQVRYFLWVSIMMMIKDIPVRVREL